MERTRLRPLGDGQRAVPSASGPAVSLNLNSIATDIRFVGRVEFVLVVSEVINRLI